MRRRLVLSRNILDRLMIARPMGASAPVGMSIVERFLALNNGAPVYLHPSEEYVTEATGTLANTSAWKAQSDPGGQISFDDGKVTIPAHANQQVVRLTLAATVPTGTRVRLWWRRLGGSGSLQPRLAPTVQNFTTSAISQLGWFSADVVTDTDKTYIDFRVPGGTGDVVFDSVCLEAINMETPLDIIVLAGQSNMAGASSGTPPDLFLDLPHPDVWAMHGSTQSGFGAVKGAITGATVPFQQRSVNTGMGPGMSFARWYAENVLETGRKVLVICAAEGGTALVPENAPWNPMGTNPTLYQAMIEDIDEALMLNPLENRVVAIYWSQGEADRGEVSSANYPTAFSNLVTALREDLDDDIPFVISGLNPFSQDDPVTTAMMIGYQEGLTSIPGVYYSGWNPDWGDGAKQSPDNINDTVHFSTDANRLRGVAAAVEFAG